MIFTLKSKAMKNKQSFAIKFNKEKTFFFWGISEILLQNNKKHSSHVTFKQTNYKFKIR